MVSSMSTGPLSVVRKADESIGYEMSTHASPRMSNEQKS